MPKDTSLRDRICVLCGRVVDGFGNTMQYVLYKEGSVFYVNNIQVLKNNAVTNAVGLITDTKGKNTHMSSGLPDVALSDCSFDNLPASGIMGNSKAYLIAKYYDSNQYLVYYKDKLRLLDKSECRNLDFCNATYVESKNPHMKLTKAVMHNYTLPEHTNLVILDAKACEKPVTIACKGNSSYVAKFYEAIADFRQRYKSLLTSKRAVEITNGVMFYGIVTQDGTVIALAGAVVKAKPGALQTGKEKYKEVRIHFMLQNPVYGSGVTGYYVNPISKYSIDKDWEGYSATLENRTKHEIIGVSYVAKTHRVIILGYPKSRDALLTQIEIHSYEPLTEADKAILNTAQQVFDSKRAEASAVQGVFAGGAPLLSSSVKEVLIQIEANACDVKLVLNRGNATSFYKVSALHKQCSDKYKCSAIPFEYRGGYLFLDETSKAFKAYCGTAIIQEIPVKQLLSYNYLAVGYTYSKTGGTNTVIKGFETEDQAKRYLKIMSADWAKLTQTNKTLVYKHTDTFAFLTDCANTVYALAVTKSTDAIYGNDLTNPPLYLTVTSWFRNNTVVANPRLCFRKSITPLGTAYLRGYTESDVATMAKDLSPIFKARKISEYCNEWYDENTGAPYLVQFDFPKTEITATELKENSFIAVCISTKEVTHKCFKNASAALDFFDDTVANWEKSYDKNKQYLSINKDLLYAYYSDSSEIRVLLVEPIGSFM